MCNVTITIPSSAVINKLIKLRSVPRRTCANVVVLYQNTFHIKTVFFIVEYLKCLFVTDFKFIETARKQLLQDESLLRYEEICKGFCCKGCLITLQEILEEWRTCSKNLRFWVEQGKVALHKINNKCIGNNIYKYKHDFSTI